MSQARFLPKFDGDQMVGLQVNAIQPDSVLREAGLNDGDLITELNGIAIDHPSQATRLVQEFRQSDVVTLVYEDAEGNVKSVEAEIQ